jgi:ferredoxin
VVTELFLAFLAQHDDASWLRAIDRLDGSMHPVDRAATRIWFHFYPLTLQRLMERPDAADLARRMTLAGRWRLADQIAESHAFLYGHRYWPQARRAVLEAAGSAVSPGSLDLAAQVQAIARRVASAAGTTPDLLVGITAVALRTLQQVGPDRLAASADPPALAAPVASLAAGAIVARRTRPGSRGILGGLFGARALSVTFNERIEGARFSILASQHVATAAAFDTRDYRSADARCHEGPIPVECRSCSCGSCWVGILAGAESLTPVDGRERAKLAECGVAIDESHPVIRLACTAQASASLTIVIPPWNGLVGRVAGSRSPESRQSQD